MTRPSFLECYYCAAAGRRGEEALFTSHDRHGCVHVCLKHAQWRARSARLYGHADDCPFADAAAPALAPAGGAGESEELRELRLLCDAVHASFEEASRARGADPRRKTELMQAVITHTREARRLRPQKEPPRR